MKLITYQQKIYMFQLMSTKKKHTLSPTRPTWYFVPSLELLLLFQYFTVKKCRTQVNSELKTSKNSLNSHLAFCDRSPKQIVCSELQ